MTIDHNVEDKLKLGRTDYLHQLAKTAAAVAGDSISLATNIPGLGTAISEIYSVVLRPPLEKRISKFVVSLHERLSLLEQSGVLNIQALADNELFVTITYQALRSAMATHQEEKIEMLRSVVINTALGRTPDEDEIYLFMNYIEAFTPWHVRILQLIEKEGELNVLGGITRMFTQYPSSKLEEKAPELRGKSQFYSQVIRDLYDRDFIMKESHSRTEGNWIDQEWVSGISSRGKEFLDFITNLVSRQN